LYLCLSRVHVGQSLLTLFCLFSFFLWPLHCCISLIYGFWLLLWYLLITPLVSSDYPLGIFKQLLNRRKMYVGDTYQQKTMFVVLAKKQGNHILFWKIKAFNNIIWPHFFCLSKVRLFKMSCILGSIWSYIYIYIVIKVYIWANLWKRSLFVSTWRTNTQVPPVVRPYIFYVKWKKKCLRKIKKKKKLVLFEFFFIETQKCLRFSTIQNKSLIFEEVI
jgi:hypothetical protein